jgi:hypothetical protein
VGKAKSEASGSAMELECSTYMSYSIYT